MREDFLEIAVESGWEVFSRRPMAAVDFVAVADALEAGVLPCSGGEGRVCGSGAFRTYPVLSG